MDPTVLAELLECDIADVDTSAPRQKTLALDDADLTQRLTLFCERTDHLELIRLLLLASANVDQPNARGVTPLCAACGAGHTQVAQLLLDHGASPTVCNTDGTQRTPLHAAARRGNYEAVRLLLAAGGAELVYARVRHRKGVGPEPSQWLTPLQLAVLMGQSAVVDELLSASDRQVMRQQCEAKSAIGTALHCAALANDATCARLLITRGADLDAIDEVDARPLAGKLVTRRGPPLLYALLRASATASGKPQRPSRSARAASSVAPPPDVAVATLLLDAGASLHAECHVQPASADARTDGAAVQPCSLLEVCCLANAPPAVALLLARDLHGHATARGLRAVAAAEAYGHAECAAMVRDWMDARADTAMRSLLEEEELQRRQVHPTVPSTNPPPPRREQQEGWRRQPQQKEEQRKQQQSRKGRSMPRDDEDAAPTATTQPLHFAAEPPTIRVASGAPLPTRDAITAAPPPAGALQAVLLQRSSAGADTLTVPAAHSLAERARRRAAASSR